VIVPEYQGYTGNYVFVAATGFLETRRNKRLGKSLENCKLQLACTIINIPWDMAAELLRLTRKTVIVWHIMA
jgi:hypothetical protein